MAQARADKPWSPWLRPILVGAQGRRCTRPRFVICPGALRVRLVPLAPASPTALSGRGAAQPTFRFNRVLALDAFHVHYDGQPRDVLNCHRFAGMRLHGSVGEAVRTTFEHSWIRRFGPPV